MNQCKVVVGRDGYVKVSCGKPAQNHRLLRNETHEYSTQERGFKHILYSGFYCDCHVRGFDNEKLRMDMSEKSKITFWDIDEQIGFEVEGFFSGGGTIEKSNIKGNAKEDILEFIADSIGGETCHAILYELLDSEKGTTAFSVSWSESEDKPEPAKVPESQFSWGDDSDFDEEILLEKPNRKKYKRRSVEASKEQCRAAISRFRELCEPYELRILISNANRRASARLNPKPEPRIAAISYLSLKQQWQLALYEYDNGDFDLPETRGVNRNRLVIDFYSDNAEVILKEHVEKKLKAGV